MNYNIEDAHGILVDYRVDEEVKNYLNTLGKEIIYTQKVDYLMDEITGHPDIFASPVKNTTVFEPRFFELYKERLKNYNIALGSKLLNHKYPDDVAYNVATLGKIAIGKYSSVDKNLMAILKKEGYFFVNVNQGYAKCSVAILDENSIITADKSISKACEDIVSIKLIKQDESIELGSMYGFIGGASFTMGKKLVFFGDYRTHKDKKAIEIFCKEKGVEPMGIGRKNLKDYGGIVPLYKN